MTWQTLEENIKTLGSFMWDTKATNETINGIKFDCVIKQKKDKWIIVEATENMSLDKIRTDIAKCAAARQYLFSQNIYPEFYIVTAQEPTESMQTTGEGNNVAVFSYPSFSRMFLDYKSYSYIRSGKAFGSSVNPFSGEPDQIGYTPVLYENVNTKQEVKLNAIAHYLATGKRIILLGNYGTGKSRCLRELFYQLGSRDKSQICYPIAINLKENWGTKRVEEMIRRHMGDLGLSTYADPIMKIIGGDNFIFLLDGFDEMGAQIWSDDSSKLQQIRATSLSAVKDLIQKTKSPIIITGREHYFNTNSEMFTSLGLSPSETILLRCKDEFTDEEMQNYLKSLSLTIDLPVWLPRRPLICQIINTIEKDKIESIFIDSNSAVEFWSTLIINICERETRISPLFTSENIYEILKHIAQTTRVKQGNTGPIAMHEINKSFEAVIGTQPVDESAAMLGRLPGLGRITSESHDRRFVDLYILDGLRAENLIDIVYKNNTSVLTETWVNNLQNTGIEIVAKRILIDKSANVFIEFLKLANKSVNKVLAGDILSILVYYASKTNIDLGGLVIDHPVISTLNFSKSLIENFTVRYAGIEQLDVSNCSFSRVSFQECFINKIYGTLSEEEIPQFITDSHIDNYEVNSMDSTNRLFNLKPSHMILISIIKKIYFLDGGGKFQREILNGFGRAEDKHMASEIILILLREKIISLDKDIGALVGKGYHRTRMGNILKERNNSKEKIWKEIGNLC